MFLTTRRVAWVAMMSSLFRIEGTLRPLHVTPYSSTLFDKFFDLPNSFLKYTLIHYSYQKPDKTIVKCVLNE